MLIAAGSTPAKTEEAVKNKSHRRESTLAGTPVNLAFTRVTSEDGRTTTKLIKGVRGKVTHRSDGGLRLRIGVGKDQNDEFIVLMGNSGKKELKFVVKEEAGDSVYRAFTGGDEVELFETLLEDSGLKEYTITKDSPAVIDCNGVIHYRAWFSNLVMLGSCCFCSHLRRDSSSVPFLCAVL